MSTLTYLRRGFVPTYRELLRHPAVRWTLFLLAHGWSVPIALAFAPGQAGADLRALRDGTMPGLWVDAKGGPSWRTR